MFCCVSDLIAVVMAQVILRNGYDIPNDFAVTGFANMSITQLVIPELSTVDQNFSMMGEHVVELLIKEINNKNKPSLKRKVEELVSVDFVLRESTLIKNKC